MPSTSFRVDPKASKLVVRTRAGGLLGRLAHDLEIAAGELAATATTDGDAWTAEVSVPSASLRVAGVLRGDRLDTSVLSASDHTEIDRRIQGDVLAGAQSITVHASGSTKSRGEALVSLGAKSARYPLSQTVTNREGGGALVSGRCDLSLRALGIPEVKGPLGAFKVSDTVEVVYTIVVVPEDA